MGLHFRTRSFQSNRRTQNWNRAAARGLRKTKQRAPKGGRKKVFSARAILRPATPPSQNVWETQENLQERPSRLAAEASGKTAANPKKVKMKISIFDRAGLRDLSPPLENRIAKLRKT